MKGNPFPILDKEGEKELRLFATRVKARLITEHTIKSKKHNPSVIGAKREVGV